MENNKKKIKIKHRILATICLALFCGAVFIAHYQPIKTYADNDTDTDYRMPGGIYFSTFDNVDVAFSYPMYAYNTQTYDVFMSGLGDISTGDLDYLSVTTIQAPDNQSIASVQASCFGNSASFRMLQFTISDFYCDKFNHTTYVPITILIEDDATADNLPNCDVLITYDVFHFGNGYYQTVTQSYTDLDLNNNAILLDQAFSLGYFIGTSNKMLHFKDITVTVFFDVAYDYAGLFMNIEFYRVTNDAIQTYNDILYEHTWEELEVSVNYLQSFYDTISGIFAIELLPNFSIGTMLELAIAIPLVVWFLKSWLGG